ncbi:hypothetical protein A9Q99_02435 [Gammaproteobacteria bacterium 45_16_T64]|nr:hypothetical protein A9Q99_02435 [Gammaproteobacteria bacterium 45_16_T64]
MRTQVKKLTPLISLLALSISNAHAKNDSLSLQGYSGLFNIPNAHVSSHGTGFIQLSDQMFYQDEYVHNKNLQGSFGIFPNIEVGGRIAWFHADTNLYTDEKEPRDLSANIKIKIPFIPEDWFSIAIGEQDIGGEASYFDATYAVISKSFGPLRVDMGYGNSTEGQRLDGGFGGVELQTLPWLSLIAEYDAKDINAGFRLNTPDSWLPNGFRVDLTVLAQSNNMPNEDNSYFGLNFRFPLSGQSPTTTKNITRTPLTNSTKNTHHTIAGDLAAPKISPLIFAANRFRKKYERPTTIDFIPHHLPPTDSTNKQTPTKRKALRAVFDKLKSYEFERIKVGSDNKGVMYISIENTIFNHNELDAIGIALGVAANLGKLEFDKTRLFLTNEGIQTIEITTNNISYAAFSNDQQFNNVDITASFPTDKHYQVNWTYNSPAQEHYKPRVTLSPAISNVIASEYGVYDYSWGIESNLALSLWKGGIANLTFSYEKGRSDDFKKGKSFYENRIRNEVQDMTIQQTLRYHSILNTTYLGKTQYDYEGVQNLTTLYSPTGTHKATFRIGNYHHNTNSGDTRDIALYSYRFYFSQFDTSTEVTGGKFWNGDKGVRLESKFWFEDNAISLVYKNTDAEFIAITWNLPLTPRKDFNSRWGQIKGKPDWTYGIQTMINNDSNDLAFGPGVIPKMQFETENTYLNRDRLSPSYLYKNLTRLREAYLRYK